ncbi:MAG: FG-GAP-like repeat-containing protein [Vicinamibacterales bacterium]
MMRYILALMICLAPFHGHHSVHSRAFAQTAAPASSAAQREAAYRANNTGVAYLEQFNYQEAERHFQEALKLHPDLALARLNLAIALMYAGRPAEAVTEAREATRRLPDAPGAHFVLGLAAKGDDKLDEAVAAFGRVLQLDPGDAGTKIHLGQIRLQQRQYPEALRLFQEAVTSEPYNVTAAYNVALALTRSGQAEEGRAAMQRFETLRDSPYGVTYAQTYLSQGRYGEAMASTGAESDLVNPAPPDVTFSDATAQMLPGSRRPAGGAGGLTLFDADGDGDLDLFEFDAQGQSFLRNQNGVFSAETAKVGLELPPDRGWSGAIAGDYDNDEKPDLFLVGEGTHRLLHQKSDRTFEDVTAKAGLPAPARVGSGAFSDLDHDGDLDLVIAGDAIAMLQNNGNGTFTDVSAKAGVTGAAPAARAVVATDYDNRRDIDLVVLGGQRPLLYRNMRDGSFLESAGAVGLPDASDSTSFGTAMAAADVNKDGYVDFFFGRAASPGVFALSDGQMRFRSAEAPPETASAVAAQFFDYDNDGMLDLLVVNQTRANLVRNLGSGQWSDVTERAHFPPIDPDNRGVTAEALALGDLDADGDTDVVLRLSDGTLRFLKNDGGNRNASLRVQLAARVSNRSGIGARVEMRAGSLRQTLETSSSTPAVAPADLLFGLGARTPADVVRVLWPSGILQAETSLASVEPRASLTITELDRKPSSCPYLFTWNGTRFEFVTDFMGGGEMGAWLAPAIWNQPDPDEYVRIRADQLRPRDGQYELRMTNELEEALFFDRVRLIAVDHTDDVEVFPNEGLRSPPRPPFRATATRGARPPERATDGHGHDILPQISALDRRYPDDFGLLPIRGYAEPHQLVLDLGSVSDRAVLLLTGWTDYAFSNDNVAASQGGVAMHPPSLQVRDRRGQWRTVIDEIGFPVGRPQTVVVDLAGKFLSASREVRILTNMRIYWDEIRVGEADRSPLRIARLDPVSADLRWRGFSEETTPDGREPFSYDYHHVKMMMPWKVMVGRYTREGEVGPLIGTTDDRFVISRPGDEIAVAFRALPPVAAGLARTFLLYVHGYSKEMNPRSALPDTVEPLPFRAMSGYPYAAGEHYPRTDAHRQYQDEYNTRVVSRPWPSIDAVANASDTTANDAGTGGAIK